jgi:acyl-CoA reductase-like NAD-dependent aldehyde dehydrogenase
MSDPIVYVVPLLIDGKELNTESTFDIISPVTAEEIWKSSSASPLNAQAAVDAAARAFLEWSITRPAFRRDIFLRAAEILERRADECKSYMHEEMGGISAFTSFNITTTAEILRDLAGRIASALTGSIPVCQDQKTNAMVFKEPYGVVLGIAPW